VIIEQLQQTNKSRNNDSDNNNNDNNKNEFLVGKWWSIVYWPGKG